MFPILYAALMAIILGYAIIKGGWAERSVALILLIGSILTPLVAAPFPRTFQQIEIGIFAIDICALILFLAVALSSRRYWPLWVVALHGVAMLGHLMPLTSRVISIVYANAIMWWSWPMLFLIGWATYRHRRRLTGVSSPS